METSKRGQHVATAGLVLQLALVGLAFALWRFAGTTVTMVGLWLIVAPVPLWLLTILMFYCKWLAQREEEQLKQLATRTDRSESIFQQEQAGLRVAANRFRWMERYLVPVFTLLFAAYHITVGLLLLRWVEKNIVDVGISVPASAMFFAIGGAFIAFLFSRYTIGMAEVQEWRLLRAPGAYLFTNMAVLVLIAAALAGDYYGWRGLNKAASYILPIFMIIIGGELVLNFILDLYRPRLPTVEVRYSYDSRLLNLIATPESIAHSIAEAINYQFGFEVSRTWFYQLLQRSLVPLLLASGLVIWLMTSIVIVHEGEQYVVLHLGKRYPERLLTPRSKPYLVWPWPIDETRKFETGKIHEIILGVGAPRKETLIRGKRIYLWTQEHGERTELDTLVAIPPSEGTRRYENAPSVCLVKMVVAVYYKIYDPYKYGYTVTNPEKLLEGIAYREMTTYAASATLDERLPKQQGKRRPQGIMSFGRANAAAELQRRITLAVDKLDLGVKILHVELLACHPPKEAAPAFEEIIAAERERDRLQYEAQSKANKMLAAVAGDPADALTLAQSISMLQQLQSIRNIIRSGGDVKTAIEQAIERSHDEIENLQKQLHLEILLGQVKPERKTVTEVLLTRQKDYLDNVLMRIRRNPRTFDFDTHIAAISGRVEKMFSKIRGEAAVTLAQARAYRWKTEFRERARAETFAADLLGFRAAPALYRLDKYLNVLTEGLQKQRKYVLGIDRNRIEVWLNLEQPTPAGEETPLGP
ncbi:MAG: hypothetical protein J7L99_07815 [Planctomycetes bacterium]|nr:hypothetical protein [Planctomycetota bacterium]